MGSYLEEALEALTLWIQSFSEKVEVRGGCVATRPERVYPFLPACVGGRVGVSGAAEGRRPRTPLTSTRHGMGDLAIWLLGAAQRAAQAA
mgnify:CR=1 FL=1